MMPHISTVAAIVYVLSSNFLSIPFLFTNLTEISCWCAVRVTNLLLIIFGYTLPSYTITNNPLFIIFGYLLSPWANTDQCLLNYVFVLF